MKFLSRKNKEESGFVALFAVLVSSILLLMALSISGIAYKEQLLSVNAKASQYSFTAADTGMECALYWDVKMQYYSLGNFQTPITCAGGTPEPVALMVPQLDFYIYKLPVNANVNGQTIAGCAVFSIDKNYDDNNDQVGDSTRIDSRGYNVNCVNIDYGLTSNGDLHFSNGAGARSVERFLSAIYLNGH